MNDRELARRMSRLSLVEAADRVGKPDPGHGPWWSRAACRDGNTDLFFPTEGTPNVVADAAKAVCELCPVRVECLEYAMSNGEAHGIWGGTSERERRRLRRERRAS